MAHAPRVQGGHGAPDLPRVVPGHLLREALGKLLDQRFWLAGDTMTLADFAAAAHISVLDYIGRVDWNLDTRAGALKDWYAKIKSRPAFRSILADQIPGFPQPSHYADLDF